MQNVKKKDDAWERKMEELEDQQKKVNRNINEYKKKLKDMGAFWYYNKILINFNGIKSNSKPIRIQTRIAKQ
jgi:hypothetical protein